MPFVFCFSQKKKKKNPLKGFFSFLFLKVLLKSLRDFKNL
jgi:hypothetical protein